jgi:sec-independent protein translocase protein TatA
MPNVGPMEIAIVVIVALIVFGPKRLPELGRGLGKGMREFKTTLTTDATDDRAGLPSPAAEKVVGEGGEAAAASPDRPSA